MKLALLAIAATVAACGTHEAQKQPLPPDRAAELLHERVWLDHAPKRPTERFHLVLFDEGGSGVRQHRTVWKGDFELFFHEVDGGELEFVLPATGTTMRSAFRVVPARGPDGEEPQRPHAEPAGRAPLASGGRAEAFTGAPMNTRVAVTDPSVLSGPPVPPLRQAGSGETLEIPRRGNGYTPPAPSPLDSARRAPEPSRGTEPAPAPSASSQGGRPPRNAALPSSSG